MNKNVIYLVVGIVLLLVVGGGAAFTLMNQSSKPISPVSETATNSQATVEQEPPPPPANLKSLKELLAAGVPQKCTFVDKSDNANVSGETYISAGKMRGDFTTAAGAGHMIVDGKTSYLWMDGQTTGFKMSFDIDKTATEAASPQQGLDVNKAVDYNCSPWTVDSSIFVPPKAIKFTDFGALKMPSVPGTQNQCSACDSLSGDSKSQCLSALKCN